MATIAETIVGELAGLSMVLSGSELDKLLVDNGLTASTTYTSTHLKSVSAAILTAINKRGGVESLSEGDLTIKWSKDGLASYIATLKVSAGIAESNIPTLTNKSSLW